MKWLTDPGPAFLILYVLPMAGIAAVLWAAERSLPHDPWWRQDLDDDEDLP